MSVFRFLLFLSLLVGSNAFVKPQYNVTGQIDSALQRFFGITLPSLKIPDLLNPDKKRNPPSIQNRIPQGNLINIGLPTIKLPNLIPTALPVIKLPTIKIPNILPTLPTIKVPTIKIPDIIPITLPTIKIPEVVPTNLPTVEIPHFIPKTLPTVKIPNIIPTNFPTIETPDIIPKILPTIKIPEIIPLTLPTVKIPDIIPITLPTIKIPEIVPTKLPTVEVPDTIPKTLPTTKIPDIVPITSPTVKIPQIIPTIKIPDIIPKNLSTLGPIKLPTIKLPTLPHILPTKSPKPTPSHKGNMVCDICEKVIGVLTTRLLEIIQKFRVEADKFLTKLCTSLTSNPKTLTVGTMCVMFKGNIMDTIFKGFDGLKKNLEPVSFCKHVPFCK
ncbi:Saposin B-type domain-containing protein [Caenorhabditis elegans]|uniref:Saposin B-type domain-containing protein n=1 Tax=Caenorhabditis elegans TaxID=6239 RepID=A0A3B1E8S4_CAEEL|nr:Saposin B-type domain-containing protein [Caenorhabditis elegans]VAY52142.1 Saposin B-type domain-containing protein [Caenorhabditis elegans]|eukprot:NP_001355419.1 Saposin-like protein 11 [Caenorhabditis elegans]